MLESLKSVRWWIETGLLVAVLLYLFGAKALSVAGYGERVAAPIASQHATAAEWAFRVDGKPRDKIERMVGELLLVLLCVDRANIAGQRSEGLGSAIVNATRAGEGVGRIRLGDGWETWANAAYAKPNCGYVHFEFDCDGADEARRAVFEETLPMLDRRVNAVVNVAGNWIAGQWHADDVAAIADVIAEHADLIITRHEELRAAAKEPHTGVGEWSAEVVRKVMPYVEGWQVTQPLEGHVGVRDQQLLNVGRVVVQAARSVLVERRKGTAR